MRFNLVREIGSHAPKHMDKLQSLVRQLKAKRVSARFRARLIGLLQFLAPLVHRGKLHLHPIQCWSKHAGIRPRAGGRISSRQTPRSDSSYPGGRIHDYSRESTSEAPVPKWNSARMPLLRAGERPLVRGLPRGSGLWESMCANWHINLLEMEAVIQALSSFSHLLQDTVVRLNCDNRTIRNEDGVRSPNMPRKVVQLLELCDQYCIHVIPVHLPGSRNVIAGSLSRQRTALPGEWSIDPQFLWSVFDLWGIPLIDMFAISLNAIQPLYISPSQDEEALDVDALTPDWNHRGLVYAFPPTVLVPRVLEIIMWSARSTRVTLVAPNSPARAWYPDLLQMAKGGPLNFSLSDRLLSQKVPGLAHRLFHLKSETLNVAAWLL